MMRKTIPLIGVAVGLIAGAGLIGRTQAQAQGEPRVNEVPAAETPPDLVEMRMPDELEGYQILIEPGNSPGQECIMIRQQSDLGGAGMCLIDWRYDGWPTPLKASAPIITNIDRKPDEGFEYDGRASVLVIAPPGRDFIVQAPAIEGRPSREIPVESTSARIEVDGVQLDVYAFAADESFDDEQGSPPDFEVVYK
jgi:hypothetical protein